MPQGIVPQNECAREFTKLRGLKIHMARWCDEGRTQRSRVGSLTDKAVKSSKSRAAEASLDKVVIGSDPPLENVPHFQYLGSRLQGDGTTKQTWLIDWRSHSRRLVHWVTCGPITDYRAQLNSGCTESVCARPSHTAARPGPSIEP